MNRLVVPIVFLFTLLPLGYGHTFYGQASVVLLLVVLGLSLALFYPLAAISTLADRPSIAHLIQRVGRLYFECSRPRLLMVMGGIFLAMTLALGYVNYGWIPFIQDSSVIYIHAKLIAQGHMTGEPYPLPEFFRAGGLLLQDPRYYSQFPPGHMMVMALGHWLGAPFLVNPLLGMFTCLAIYALARDIYDEKTARLSLLLCLVSPWMLFMSAEFLNHATSLLFSTLFLFFFLRSVKTGTAWASLLAGFCLAYAGITRPYTALAVAFPCLLYGAYLTLANIRTYAPRFMVCAIGALPPAIFLLWFNHATTGDPLTFGYQKLDVSTLGFVPIAETMQPFSGKAVHTLWNGIGQAFNTLNALNYYLFCWPTASLIFLPLAFWKRTASTEEKLLLATFVSLIVFYIYYYFQDWTTGPRFAYEAFAAYIMFTACGLLRAPGLLAGRFKLSANALAMLVALCCVFGVTIGCRLIPGHSWWPVAKNLHHTLEARIQQPAIVFMGYTRDLFPLTAYYYPVTPASQVIIAVDHGPEKNQKLLALYPGYHVYLAGNLGTPDEIWEEIRP